MKKIYVLIFVSLFMYSLHAQQGLMPNYETYFKFNSPLKETRTTLNNAHGAGMDMYIPWGKSNILVGLSGSASMYGYERSPVKFTAMDGSTIDTYASVTNSIMNLSIASKYYFLPMSNSFNIYVDAKAGLSFFRTRFYIEDPEDTDNCQPLENLIVQSDNAFTGYAGTGMELKLSGMFNKERAESPCPIYLNLGAGYYFGGSVSYMNADNPECHTGQQPNPSQVKSTPYYSSFVNTQTQTIHQHQVGNTYTSKIKMLEFKFGISIRLSK